MSFTNTLAGPARRFLAERVRQLCQRLEQLGRRLREGIAQIVSQTVAEGVHEAVHSALENKSPPSERPQHTHYWDQDERRMPYDPDPWRDHDGFGWEAPPPVAPPPPAMPAKPVSRWRSALWAGLEATAWWLSSRPSNRPLLSSLGFGAVVGLTAFVAGPLAAMLMASFGSALALLALAEKARNANFGG